MATITSILEKGFEMHDPPHPGEVLRRLYLEPLGLTVTETTPESWLNMQTYYDLWQAKKKRKALKVKQLGAA